MKMTPALAAFLGTLLLASPAMAQIYKWTDEKGVTHYSADPPPANASNASQVKVQTRLPSDSEAATQNLEKQRAESRKAAEAGKSSKAEDKKSAVPAKQPPEQYAERCKSLRGNLKTIQENARIRLTDEKGETRMLSEEEKQAKLDDTQRQIKAFCE